MAEPPGSLSESLKRFTLGEILRLDFYAGVLGGVGAVLLALYSPETLASIRAIAAGILGIVVGAVVGGAAILAAFLSQAFIRKLRMIGSEPMRFLEPFLLTAWLGVVGIMLVLVLGALPPATPTWLLATVGGLAGFSVVWAITSIFWDLDMLVQFVGLQVDASEASLAALSNASGLSKQRRPHFGHLMSRAVPLPPPAPPAHLRGSGTLRSILTHQDIRSPQPQRISTRTRFGCGTGTPLLRSI